MRHLPHALLTLTLTLIALTCLVPAALSSAAANDGDDLLARVEKAIAADPKNPRNFLLRARVHESQRQWAKAAEDYAFAIALTPDAATATDLYHRRGEAQFRAGNIDGCLLDFGVHLKHHPDDAPHHWQRGLALYYAGRFDDGRKQFESHQTVNPADVENAAWHYLCVARLEGVEKARAALIPIEGDRRIPMMKVHALYAGKATVDDVLAAARANDPGREELDRRLFYAHLYIGLYHEAAGETAKAQEHVFLAERYADEGYMGDVARVHAARMRRRAATTAPVAK